MKKLLITIAHGIEQIAEPFLSNQKEFCARHGYEYRCVTEKGWPHLAASFSKVFEIDRAMKDGFERIIWCDADIGVMDMRHDLGGILDRRPGFWMAGYRQSNWKSWPYICNGLLILNNCEDLRKYTDQWIDRCLNGCPITTPGTRMMILDAPFEQWHSDGLNREWKFQGIAPIEAPEIGCFSKEIWHDGVLWARPMPTIHCGGPATWERRAQVFTENYQPKVRR